MSSVVTCLFPTAVIPFCAGVVSTCGAPSTQAPFTMLPVSVVTFLPLTGCFTTCVFPYASVSDATYVILPLIVSSVDAPLVISVQGTPTFNFKVIVPEYFPLCKSIPSPTFVVSNPISTSPL